MKSSLGAALAIARKELVASLRDRQTAIYTFVLPICLYPVVFWLMVQGALVVRGQRERTAVTVGVAAAREAAPPEGLVAALEARAEGEGGRPARTPIPNEVAVEEHASALAEPAARAWVSGEAGDPLAAESEPTRPDAVLFLPSAQEIEEGARARLFYQSSKSRSELARDRISQRLPPFAARLRGAAARERGVDPGRLEPVEVQRCNVAPRRDVGALILSSLLPILLVVMAVMGSFFPAVDLTTGEKERRTAETTLLLPVPRATVHQGKILAVCATAVVATFLNLLAIALSAEHLLSMLNIGGGGPQAVFELPVLALLATAPLALLFAFFVSAVLTGVAGLAATFKEGQALLGPVQMVFILPALIGVMPGLELTLGWAFVPVVNVVLAFRAMLVGEPLYLAYTVTALALLVYAWIAIRVAVRLLSREEVLLAGATIPVKRLLSVLRGEGGSD